MKNIKIDYKLTTFVLLAIVIVNLIWEFSESKYNTHNNKNWEMGSMHQMPNGEMMMDDDMTQNNMQDMMMDMTANMQGKSGKDLEKSFITEMIPHHQGAVDMAKLLLEDKTIDPKIANFAKNIISAQEQEIIQMKDWLKKY